MASEEVVVVSPLLPSAAEWPASVGRAPVVASNLEEIWDRLSSAGCILIDADAGDPLRLASSAREVDPELQVVLVVSPEGQAPLERRILFHPGLGELWLVGPLDVSPELVARASSVTERRRRHRRTRAHVGARLSLGAGVLRRRMLSDEHLSRLLRLLPDAVFSLDQRGRVQFANQAAVHILGRPAHELVGCTLWELVSGAEDLEELLRAGGEGRVRVRFRDGEGEGTLLLTSMTQPDEVVRIAVVRDETDERQAQRELALAQRKLIAADRLASLGTMSAAVAHEVNNPLAYVIPNLQLLDSLVKDPELSSLVADVRDGVERIRKIVSGLRAFSRGDEREELRPTRLDVAADNALALTSRQVRLRAQLEKRYQPARPVMADESRLVQVLVNLLLNAAHALPECRAGEHVVHVEVGESEAGESFVRVRDTGPGIAPEVLPHIFEPFFTTKGVGEGTGLGLSISHGIIGHYGGRIEVSTELGRGTAFTVYLPAVRAADAPVEVSPSAGPEGHARVLVIDDEPLVRSAIARVLADHDVTIAGSANEALAELEAGRRFDLIMCDMMMPRTGGAELYAILAERFPRQAERVVIMTGGASTEKAQRFLDEVAPRWIEKPCPAQVLRALAAKATAQKG